MADPLVNFKKRIQEVEHTLNDLKGVSVKPGANSILDYNAGKAEYLNSSRNRSIRSLREGAWGLVQLREVGNDSTILDILNSVVKLGPGSTNEEVMKALNDVGTLSAGLKSSGVSEKPLFTDIPELPETIMPDVMADLNEIRKCFDAASYRSCVVLCGRVLETALHRKYFEATGKDLMQTSPDIGLGKLVAKLKEMNIQLDPGIMQQIHLINQVRVFSVHSKREAFYPSKGQSEAMILYTIDILRKLFV